MRLRWWRRTSTPQRRASHAATQVLEYDLYGTPVEAGTMAAAAIGLRALGAAGTSSREMMHAMNDCTATGTICLDNEDIVVICNLAPHGGDQHHDVVHGDWNSAPAAS